MVRLADGMEVLGDRGGREPQTVAVSGRQGFIGRKLMRDDEIISSGVARRTFMAGVGGAVALSMAGGTANAAAAKEAPQLAALVKDGKLPPLAQRLPQNPMVVKPWEKVGTYGGTLRRGLRGSSDHNGILRMVG